MSNPAENQSQSSPEAPRPRTGAVARFVVSGAAEPGVAPRVLELFAKRGLVPDDFHARAANGRQTIEVRARAMTPDLAAYIGRCLRQIVHVERVLVSREERVAESV